MNDLLRAAVWAKAIDGPFGTKLDPYGNMMFESDYGDPSSAFGWELDHYPIPKCAGGPDELWNLRALNCSQNRRNGGLLGQLRNALQEAETQRPPNVFRGLFALGYRDRQ